MKNNKFYIAFICFMFSFFTIVAMFITAESLKSGYVYVTTIGWIKNNFKHGVYWFIIAAVLFAVIGILLLLKSDWFVKLWNNKLAMIIISTVLTLTFPFFFLDFIFMYIVCMVISIIVCIYVSYKIDAEEFKENIGKMLIIAVALGFVMFLFMFLGTLVGGDCQYCGGRGYFGGGKQGQMVDCPHC